MQGQEKGQMNDSMLEERKRNTSRFTGLQEEGRPSLSLENVQDAGTETDLGAASGGLAGGRATKSATYGHISQCSLWYPTVIFNHQIRVQRIK